MSETKSKTKWQFFTFSGGNFADTLAYQVLGEPGPSSFISIS